MSGTVSGEGLLARAVTVLDCFTEDEPALPVARIAAMTGLPSSSLHRLLAQLTTYGLLARTTGHRYTIGARLWELGELSPLSLRLRETALPHMLRLYEATLENVHLAVLDGLDPESASALYVGRMTGRESIPTLSRMGGRHPLHTTGVGKALLAQRDDAWLDAFLRHPLHAETTRSITSPEVLRGDLDQTRTRGYAVTREEMTLGNASVAAAVLPIEGLPPIAIGIVAHLEHADVPRLGRLVMLAAEQLGHDLAAGSR